MKDGELYTYPAIFTEENGEYWVEFFDIEGCFSSGKTLSQAMENAKEALGLYLEDLKEIPVCTEDIKKIKVNKNQVVSFVTVNMNEYKKKYSNTSIKKTLSIPAWLNTLAEENEINFSQVLQEALKYKLGVS